MRFAASCKGRIEVLGVGERAIVVGVGTTPITIVGDAEIVDEVPGPVRVLEAADSDELDVAALLPSRIAGRDAELRAYLVAGAKKRVAIPGVAPVASGWQPSCCAQAPKLRPRGRALKGPAPWAEKRVAIPPPAVRVAGRVCTG